MLSQSQDLSQSCQFLSICWALPFSHTARSLRKVIYLYSAQRHHSPWLKPQVLMQWKPWQCNFSCGQKFSQHLVTVQVSKVFQNFERVLEVFSFCRKQNYIYIKKIQLPCLFYELKDQWSIRKKSRKKHFISFDFFLLFPPHTITTRYFFYCHFILSLCVLAKFLFPREPTPKWEFIIEH